MVSSAQVLGPQKEMNINARTGSSAAATVPLTSSARRDESAGGDGEDAVALAPRHRQPTRLITCLRLRVGLATLHAHS